MTHDRTPPAGRSASARRGVARAAGRLRPALARRTAPWALAVLVLGVLASLGAAGATRGVEQHNAQQLLDRRAATAGTAVTGELRRYQDTATQIAAALGPQPPTAAGFAAVTAPLSAAGLPGASGIAFVVPVTGPQFPALRSYWSARGATLLATVPSGSGTHDLPVFRRILDGGQSTAGTDLAGVPALHRALGQAAASRTTVVSDTFLITRDRVLPVAQQQPAFAMVAPVYEPAAAGQRTGALRGWVVIGMRAHNLAAGTLRQSTQGLVNLTLVVRSSIGQPVVAAVVDSGRASSPAVSAEVPVPVAQQQWVLRAENTTEAAGLDSGYARLREVLVLGGSGFSLLLALMVLSLLTSRRRALEDVDTATIDLEVAEAGRRRQTVLFETVMDSIGDAVAAIDGEGAFILLNPAARELLDIEDDDPGPPTPGQWQESFGIYYADGVTPCLTADMPLVRALAGESPDQVELVFRNRANPDGARIEASARRLDATADMPGGGAVAVFRDVTTARDLQAQQWEQAQRYERLLHVLSDLGEGMVIAEESRFVFVNDAYANLTGYTPGELIAMDVDEVAADPQALSEFADWRDHLAEGGTGGSAVMYTRIRHKDGHLVPVETVGLTVESGGRRQRVSVSRDLTERWRIQAELATRAAALETANTELAAARDAADEASRAKSVFLATMSHEIRTPLNAVIGLTDLLMDTRLDGEQRDYLTTVHSSGETLLGLINDILDWSKIGSGALDLEWQPFDLRECVESAVEVVAAQPASTGLDIFVQLELGCPEIVVGDVTRLRQILVNLVGNAVKFTEAGHVLVTASLQPESLSDPGSDSLSNPDESSDPDSSSEPGTLSESDTLAPALPPSDSLAPPEEAPGPDAPAALALRLTVGDTGIGIPPEKVGRLFHDFTQVDDSTTREYGGTGLGLAISQRLAQAMGGAITVVTEPGVGSTFTVDVWLRAVDPDDGGTAHQSPAVLADRRVLLIDPTPLSRQILAAQLRGWGLHSAEAGSVVAALALLRRGTYDLALMNVPTDTAAGALLLGELAELTAGAADLPIVLLTSLTNRALSATVAQAPARHLTRPVRAATLRDTFVELLSPPPRPGERSTPAVPQGASLETAPASPTHSPAPIHSATPSPVDSAEPGGAPGSAGRGIRVLLVEDNLVNRTVAQLMLGKLGYTADTAVNGQEAVAAVNRVGYDVVLMDVQMPVLDGLEATRILRRTPPPGPRPWVIALTANAQTEDREQCSAAGMDDYLSKPVRRDELADVLARIPAAALSR